MSQEHIELTIQDGIARVLVNRPEARNAMTWAMYESLGAACEKVRRDPSIRVMTIRGAGGEAFVAGTDIEQFRAFQGGDDGIAYEKVIDERIGQIESLPVPTIALVDGWAIGGGLAISAACDFRIATPKSAFGVPIARTLGNCLSPANVARLVSAFGAPRTRRMLLLADTIPADEALACGFVTEIAPAEELEDRANVMCARLMQHAPVTMRVSKEAVRRVVAESVPEGADLIRECYGSRDFRVGVDAFLDKKRPQWTGS